jgi:hypothetical protein
MKKIPWKYKTGWVALNDEGTPFIDCCNPLIYLQHTKPEVNRGDKDLLVVQCSLAYLPPKKSAKK